MDGTLTGPSGMTPRAVAESYTREQMQQAGIEAAGLYLEKEYNTEHNGVTHLIYRQRFQGLDISGAEWVVNIDRQGQILNAGGKLFNAPAPGLQAPSSLTMRSAARKAAIAVNPVLAAEANIAQAGLNHRAELRFSTGGAMGEITGRPVWYPVRGELQPAWEFVVTDGDGISTYETVIDARTEMVLAKEPLTMFQAPRGSVFTGISPQPPVKYGVASTTPPPYADRDSVAFPPAWLDGAETAGNNTITGHNPLGVRFLETPLTARSATRDFQFPLTFTAAPTNYVDAATTNLFYWVNRAHDLFYSIGFDEASGNYQQHNFGRGGLGGDPMLAYVQFGAQSPVGFADLNNAFYTSRGFRDGEPSMIAMYLTLNSNEWADGSLANDVILHEYTHGVTRRLVRSMTGFQGGAMSEAFSDFWALEWIVPEGADPNGAYTVGDYWDRAFGIGIRSRPYSTNLEINPITYRDLGRVNSAPSIHNDGGIWVMALWEARANLIQQFGEREGRRRLRLNVLDGMKLAPPTPSMVDMRDAILLADRVNFKGESQTQLWEAFAKRGLGVLAVSDSAATINATASFEKPSNAGQIGVREDIHSPGDPLRILVHDGNNTAESITVDVTSSSGDVENVRLVRRGSFFLGTLFTSPTGPARKNTNSLSLLRGDAITIYYNDFNTGSGPRLIEKTIATSWPYGATVSAPTFTFPNERLLSRRPFVSAGFDRFTLPFDFPFHGRNYREVRINAEGFLQFDVSEFPTCLDATGFANIAAIAPMATWMRTNGAAQPNEGLFVSTGPNSVTFRWAGETNPLVNAPPFTPGPVPLNFAATLRENGEITFHYGTGNSGVVSGAVLGCASSSPFVGISRGTGTPPLTHIFAFERANFAGAPNLEIVPPFGHASAPSGRVDSPAEGASIEGLLTVLGVVMDTDQFLSGVHVVIDGIYEGTAVLTAAPAGTCPPNSPRCDARTFTRTFDPALLNLKPGLHSLQVRAVNSKAAFTDLLPEPRTFIVSDSPAPQPKVVIESPDPGVTWKDSVVLRGYAYSARTRITQLDVIIDNIAYGRGVLGQPRADICAGEAAGAPNCPGIGWLAVVSTASAPLQPLPNGDHKLQIRITEETGRVTLHPETPIEIKVDNPTSKPPAGVVTSPTNAQKVSGTITVRGYGWDPDGRVRSVTLLIDNVSRATLRYGLPSPEACASLPDVTACPNIGFEGTFDTKLLRNGPHRLGVLLSDDAGKFTVIPATTLAGMNITVEN